MSRLQNLAPLYIRNIAAYQPGKPIAEVARELGLAESNIIKLASNENPLGLSPKARAAIMAELTDIPRYPDGNGFLLKQKISEKFSVRADMLVLGNGSNEIIELITRTFLTNADNAIFSQYAFSVYPLAIQQMGAEGICIAAKDYGHDLPAMAAAINSHTKLVFLANPNNPTGTTFSGAELQAFLDACPDNVLVALDEAYTEFLDDGQRIDAIALLPRYPNLIVCRTLSKAYGLAGLRVGFAVTHPDIADLMNRVRQPFNVNSLAQAAAVAVLDDAEFLARSRAVNKAGMHQLTQAFTRLNIEYIPSHGNFITFHCHNAQALNLFMLQHGVIIRPLASYDMPDSLRVSIGTEVENARFIEVLEQYREQAPGVR